MARITSLLTRGDAGDDRFEVGGGGVGGVGG